MIRPSNMRAILATVLITLSWAAQALTIKDLQDAGRLSIDSSVEPATGIVPGQKIHLTIELSTDRWFSGGSRFSLPDVPGLIILQTESFANNASENRDGKNWVVQRWTLDVYAQREGQFVLPPIAVSVKVNDEQGEVQGQLYTREIALSALQPTALEAAQQWVAAPKYEVRQSFDRSLEGLQPGDAIERKIYFVATDVMAMMLPTFSATQHQGLAAYTQPPQLSNVTNRGIAVARRTETISYMVETQGTYTLPALDYFWWDTVNEEATVLSLPAVTMIVGAGLGPKTESTLAKIFEMPQLSLRTLAYLLASVLALALLYRSAPRPALMRYLKTALSRLRQLREPALPAHLNPPQPRK